ncbi:8811_t:CDS:1 [Funneliformis caledonium]|uniref:8811_t:CDS:1 n=1 Tax=Funneliformis caledonium TaxID=1117310 RepID=A0A9N9F6G5_9GLOM|nr:8811_t:CDS:1 [Funneliformis caledonium]
MSASSDNSNHHRSVLIPTEILSQIFSYLQKDYVSLYNCLLVNKFWHINTLEVLYSKPFHLLQSNSHPSRINNDQTNLSNTLQNYLTRSSKNDNVTIEDRIVKLIDLYIKCLRYKNDFKEIEVRLNENGIFYIYKNQDFKNLMKIETNLLFDYSSYLKYLRYDDLYNFISIYLSSFSNGVSFVNNVRKSLFTYNPYSIITKRTIVMELFKIFLKQQQNLIELSISTNFINDFRKFEINHFNGIDQDLLDIFKDQTLPLEKKGRKGNNINTLICGGIKFDEILKLLQNNLRLTSIKNFIIDFNLPPHSNDFNFGHHKYQISSEKIIDFLSLQKKLKKLCVVGRYCELYNIFYRLSDENILEQLTCLEFYGIIFHNNLSGNQSLMTGIIQCANLQELVFEDCVNLTSDIVYQIRNSRFTSLKKFTLRNCSGKNINSLSSHNSIATLIRNACGGLEEVRFGRKLKWFIRKIYDVGNIVLDEMTNCEKLKVVECCVLIEIVEDFFEVLKMCKNLVKVNVSVDYELSDNESFWKRFGSALSENRTALNELSICIGGTGGNGCENELWIEMFEWFFGSCDIHIEILKFPMCYSINENYLKIIGRYAKRVGEVKKVMLCEGVIRRKYDCTLMIEGIQCVRVCRDDVEFDDDDLVRRGSRFRNGIQ